jgi:hypothetical protein
MPRTEEMVNDQCKMLRRETATIFWAREKLSYEIKMKNSKDFKSEHFTTLKELLNVAKGSS